MDLLYHDATYCEGDEELASKYDHSTASQAAEFAKACGAGKLMLGHRQKRGTLPNSPKVYVLRYTS